MKDIEEWCVCGEEWRQWGCGGKWGICRKFHPAKMEVRTVERYSTIGPDVHNTLA